MIRQFRKKYGLTQRRLAELMGVTITTIYSWESGRRNPGGPAKILLAKVEEELEKKMKMKKEVKKYGKGDL
ncbi:MAG: helix-turn-helix domain-containing protein [Thermodesulfobacteriota bacterium]|jgi:putative transcriptional regulator